MARARSARGRKATVPAGSGRGGARGRAGGARGRVEGAGRGGGVPMGEIQRMRLLLAAAQAVRDLGVLDVAVVDVVSRAGVSRKTFYEHFADREQCLAAAFEEALARAASRVLPVWRAPDEWRLRVRAALACFLAFVDGEPMLGALLVADSAGIAAARRGEVLGLLAAAVDEGRTTTGRVPRGVTSLTAEGVVGAVLSIVRARLFDERAGGVSGLLGELMAIIVLPYLGPTAAAREQARPLPAPPAQATGAHAPAEQAFDGVGRGENPFKDLGIRVTYRTVRVLSAIGELSADGAGPSSAQVARHADVRDLGQISKLLARLVRAGLIEIGARRVERGEPYAWRLTARGLQLHEVIAGQHAAGALTGPSSRDKPHSRRG